MLVTPFGIVNSSKEVQLEKAFEPMLFRADGSFTLFSELQQRKKASSIVSTPSGSVTLSSLSQL